MSIRSELRYWGFTTIASVGLIGATALITTSTLVSQYESDMEALTSIQQESSHSLALAGAFAARQAQLAIAPSREVVDLIAADQTGAASVASATTSLKAIAELNPETNTSVNRIASALEHVLALDHEVLERARAVVDLRARFEAHTILARRDVADIEVMVDGFHGEVRLEQARSKRRLTQFIDDAKQVPRVLQHVRDLLQGDAALLERAAWELSESVQLIGTHLERIDSARTTHELLNLAVNELRQSFDRARDAVSVLTGDIGFIPARHLVVTSAIRETLANLEEQVLTGEASVVPLKQALLHAHEDLLEAQRSGQATLKTLYHETKDLAASSERYSQRVISRLNSFGLSMQLGVALVFTVVVVTTAWFIAGIIRRIYLPVKKIRQAMRDVAEGELSTRLSEDRAANDNEIALLASDFNRATATTEQLVEQLALSNARLEAGESHIRSILNGVPDGILTLDRNGQILTHNVVAERIFGAKHTELLQHSFLDLLRDNTTTDDTGARLKTFSHGHQTIGRRLDGTELPLWVSVTASDSSASGSLIAVVADMTAYAKSEEQRRKSEALFKTLYENAPVMVAGFTKEGQCVLWNRELERALGWSLQEINGLQDFLARLFPDPKDRKQPLAQFAQCDGVYRESSPMAKNGQINTHLWACFQLPDGLVISTGYDITERKVIEEQLQSTSKELDTILQNVLVGIAYVRDGHLLRVNRRFEELFACPPDSFNGKPLAKLFDDESLFNELETEVSSAFQRSESLHTERPLRRLNGEAFWCSISVTQSNEGKHHESAIWLLEDVSRRHQSEQQLLKLAKFDPLTGLPNRSMFIERLQTATTNINLEQFQVAVMFLDLDHFKDINDSLGHRAGDMMLREVSKRLNQVVRGPDLVARLGGDEFTVLHCYDPRNDDTAALAERIINAISRPYLIEGIVADISPSIGISRCPIDGTEVGILLRNADTAMYDAKLAGRNTYRFYASAMHEAAQQRMALGAALRRAFDQRSFTLHYQPQFDLNTGEMVGVEALLRLPHSEMGPLTPDVFIPALEDTGMIVPVGDWVLEQALIEARPLIDQGICLAVNISGRQFREPEFVNRLESLVRNAGIPAYLLELELTETVLMADSEHAVKSLDAINDLGIRLSVDDFGIGYSSLTYLKRFPLDTLKIDRSFIRDIPQDSDDAAIVEAILAMARRLGLLVVAEGVETEGQRDFLRFNRCDRAQGFLYAHPSPIAQVLARLATASEQSNQRTSGYVGGR